MPVAPRGRILLVEDNAVNRELILQQLEELGFLVDTADNGQQGLQRWSPGHYVAVLTDINMPVMNGYELATALRERDAGLPILAITATALSSERERCRAAGITDILLKPMSLGALDTMLARHVGDLAQQRPGSAAAPAPARRFPPRVLRLFVDTGRDDLATLSEALRDSDNARAIERLHSFKGALQMLGERALAERCGAFEQALQHEPIHTLEAPIRHLIVALSALLDTCEADLGNTQNDRSK
jgi:two-component system capsular synthesis sensor histidine kinase RcsC